MVRTLTTSTSLTTDANGNFVSRQLYDAWGNIRQRGTLPTDIGFTGQREDTSTNLMFYNARYYSPYLNRWIQPDTIVPDFADPQQLNRFSYTLNNPLKYTDPSGHCITNNKTKDGGYEQTRGDYFDCSVDELNALEWDARSWWIGQLGATGGSAGWFKNIQTVLAFFRNTPGLNDLNGWASTADAPLLWVIQEGYRSYANPNYATDTANPLLHDAAKAWAEFFGSQKEDDLARISRWGQAEILGTRAGEDIADGLVARPTGEAGSILANFIYIGDNYRQYLKNGSCDCDFLLGQALSHVARATDPRTDNVKYGIALAVFRGDAWWNLLYKPLNDIFGGAQ